MTFKVDYGGLLRVELGKCLAGKCSLKDFYGWMVGYFWNVKMDERGEDLLNDVKLRFYERSSGALWTDDDLKDWFIKAIEKYDSSKQ